MVQLLRRRKAKEEPADVEKSPATESGTRLVDPIPIAEGDPLETVLLTAGGPVEVAGLDLESEALERIRVEGIELVVPLIGQGELLGALYLGPRLSDQPYSTDDRRLMENLASQVAPAIKVAQLVRQQQVETEERERVQQEMRVAALIQQTLLPKELPSIPGWSIDAFYRPARAVGGDFYDFIPLKDGRLGVVIGDVTDKGVPAALVMATSRSMLRAAAHSHSSPGAALAEVNDSLVPEIPPAMFVTCLYAVIDTDAGEVVFANAGHNLPYVRGTGDGVTELRATGMPLGLMPGMEYEEQSYTLDSGEVMVLTSDGITEAHNAEGEMYGFSRLMGRIAAEASVDMVSVLVGDLERFSGPDAEQEDDITLVVVERVSSAEASAAAFGDNPEGRVLTTFSVSSDEGNERIAIDKVTEAVSGLGLESAQVERLRTAVGESVMNAIEHGNENRSELSVDVEVLATAQAVVVRVTDHGGGPAIPEVETPDIEAKIAGEQTPRGWGLFLIGQMVDELRTDNGEGTHIVELVINREGADKDD